MIKPALIPAALACVIALSSSARAEEKSWLDRNAEVVALYKKEKLGEAEKLGAQVIEQAEATFGPEHPYVAAASNNLAAVYHAQGKYAEAERLYRRAYEIDRRAFGPDHPTALTDRAALNDLLAFTGRTFEEELPSPSEPAQIEGVPVAEATERRAPGGASDSAQPPAEPEPEPATEAPPAPEPVQLAAADPADDPHLLPVAHSRTEEEREQGWIETEFAVDGGYRQDKLNWSIAGNLQGTSPNILSELTWEDLEIYEVKGTGRLTFPGYAELRGSFGYGWIYAGKNQDSDYLGNNRSFEFSRSNNNSDDGSVLDASLGIGYPFRPAPKYNVRVTPLAGYSYHEQHLTITDGNQTVPNLGPFDNLDSEYEAYWQGPWVGLDLSFDPSVRWRLFGSFEWHWVTDYRGDARWNLRDDFEQPLSFRQTADEGKGLVGTVGIAYLLNKRVALRGYFEAQDWSTEDGGLDEVFFSNGTRSQTQLNEVNWESYAGFLGVTVSY